MNPALWISKTGLDAQQTDISVISNNLANASTVGYKKSRAVFEDLLYQNINQPGGRSSQDTEMPSGLMLGAGAKVVANQKNFSQGNMLSTENSLDWMVQGQGFLRCCSLMAILLTAVMVNSRPTKTVVSSPVVLVFQCNQK